MLAIPVWSSTSEAADAALVGARPLCREHDELWAGMVHGVAQSERAVAAWWRRLLPLILGRRARRSYAAASPRPDLAARLGLLSGGLARRGHGALVQQSARLTVSPGRTPEGRRARWRGHDAAAPLACRRPRRRRALAVGHARHRHAELLRIGEAAHACFVLADAGHSLAKCARQPNLGRHEDRDGAVAAAITTRCRFPAASSTTLS